ncbi:MAG: hypothetical protein IKE01_07155 [Clostridia bacterium]|nr:hypothetical protein [Clostridia bacterium]
MKKRYSGVVFFNGTVDKQDLSAIPIDFDGDIVVDGDLVSDGYGAIVFIRANLWVSGNINTPNLTVKAQSVTANNINCGKLISLGDVVCYENLGASTVMIDGDLYCGREISKCKYISVNGSVVCYNLAISGDINTGGDLTIDQDTIGTCIYAHFLSVGGDLYCLGRIDITCAHVLGSIAGPATDISCNTILVHGSVNSVNIYCENITVGANLKCFDLEATSVTAGSLYCESIYAKVTSINFSTE